MLLLLVMALLSLNKYFLSIYYMWWTREKLARLSGVYSAWIISSILKNSFHCCPRVAGMHGEKCSKTMYELRGKSAMTYEEDPPWLLEGKMGTGVLETDHSWLMFVIRERKKSRGGAKGEEQNIWLTCVRNNPPLPKRQSVFALSPLPPLMLLVFQLAFPIHCRSTGSWEPCLPYCLPFPPLSPMSASKGRISRGNDQSYQDLDPLHHC